MLGVTPADEMILGRSLFQNFDINRVVGKVCAHYVERALADTNDSKTKAAELLNLKNYQTLNNWMDKYGIELLSFKNLAHPSH